MHVTANDWCHKLSAAVQAETLLAHSEVLLFLKPPAKVCFYFSWPSPVAQRVSSGFRRAIARVHHAEILAGKLMNGVKARLPCELAREYAIADSRAQTAKDEARFCLKV